MKHSLKTCYWELLGPAVLLSAFALSGCTQPAAPKEQSAGLNAACVGMGCEGKVSAGLQEKCVGMGCPSDDTK